MFPKWDHCTQINNISLTSDRRYAVSMIIAGLGCLEKAIKSKEVPAIAARCWYLEASDAQWAKARDVVKLYNGTEKFGKVGLLIPIDNAGHCVGVNVDYTSGTILITFAGHRRNNPMESGKAGRA